MSDKKTGPGAVGCLTWLAIISLLGGITVIGLKAGWAIALLAVASIIGGVIALGLLLILLIAIAIMAGPDNEEDYEN